MALVEIQATVGRRRTPEQAAAVFAEDWSGYPLSNFGNPEGLDGKRRWTQGKDFTARAASTGFTDEWAGWCNGGGFAVAGVSAPGVQASLSRLDYRSRWSAALDDDLGSSDHYARMTVGELTGTPNDFGPLARVSVDGSGNLTCYWLQMRPGSQNVRIWRLLGGVLDSTVSGVSAAHTHATGDTYELRVHGTTLSILVNGTVVASGTDATPITSGTQAGIHCSTSSNQAVRATGFEAGLLDGGGDPVAGSEHPPVPAVQFAWCGIPVGGTAPIACSTRNVDAIRVVVADDELLSSIVYTSAYLEPDDLGLVQFRATGLAADTVHWWALQLVGAEQIGPVRRFRTPPTGQASFTWAMSGDLGSRSMGQVLGAQYRMVHTADPTSALTLATRDPDFFVFAGDRHYRDYNTTDLEPHLLGHRELMVNPRVRSLYDAMAVSQMWDDHDFTGDSANASTTGRDAAVDVWRRAVPSEGYMLTGDLDPVGYTFTWGRVRFIIMDHRSAKATGTILGTAQKNAVLDLIENATEELIVLSVGIPWVATSSSDNWNDATAERTEIANAIEAHKQGKVIIVHADAHMFAADDGTNSQYATGSSDPGPWVFCNAPLNSGNSIKGGPYSEGTIPDTLPASSQHYGVFDVDDQGTQIVVTWTAWDVSDAGVETDLMTRQVTVSVGGG